MEEVKHEAKPRNVEVLVLPTQQAIRELERHPEETYAILHLTC